MKLYFAPGTCALACWISLEWADADYTVEKVNPSSEEYRKINPLGMVPAVDINGSRPMTQADAILQHIVKTYPETDLGANDGVENDFEFAEVMAFLSGDFHPAFWPMFFPQRYTTSTDEAELANVKSASYLRIDIVMKHLDRLIGDTLHVYQDKRTVADAYAFVMALWSVKTPNPWETYPNIKRFMDHMYQDEAVKKVLELSK